MTGGADRSECAGVDKRVIGSDRMSMANIII